MYKKKKRMGRRPAVRRPGGRVANSQATDNVVVPDGLVFYCRSCKKILDFHPKTFNFKTPLDCCQKDNSGADEDKKARMKCDVVYGTERSVKHYFKINDGNLDVKRKEDEEKAARADKF